MSTERPSLTPELLASLLEALPARMKKRLDGAPTAADAWTWSADETRLVVATDGEEKVTLTPQKGATVSDAGADAGRIDDLSQVVCTCLLSPRCFHAAAVLSVLPVALPAALGADATSASSGTPTAGNAGEPSSGPAPEALTAQEIAVGSAAFSIASDVLAAGFSATSALRTAALLRVSFEARKVGVPAIENAILRVFSALRARATDDPDFRLADATRDLAELLTLAQRLRTGDASAVGIARNVYVASGSVRVTGLFCEPILVGGQAGVVTHFSDGKRLFSAGDVMPGSAERAVAAYEAPLRFGEVSIPQREAARKGLVFAAARVAANGRLGAGKEVVVAATRADEATRNALFATPLETQLARAATASGQGLVFLEGFFAEDADGKPAYVAEFPRPGASSDGDADLRSVAVRLVIAIDDPRFAFRENLALLATNCVQVRLIARLEPGTSAAVVPLALVGGGRVPEQTSEATSSEDEERSLKTQPFPFEADDIDVVNLGFDRIRHARFPRIAQGVQAPRLSPQEASGDPLAPLRRRLVRYALAGRGSLPATTEDAIRKDAAALEQAFLRGGATLLHALAAAAGGHDRVAAAERFVAAHAYMVAAEQTFANGAWLPA